MQLNTTIGHFYNFQKLFTGPACFLVTVEYRSKLTNYSYSIILLFQVNPTGAQESTCNGVFTSRSSIFSSYILYVRQLRSCSFFSHIITAKRTTGDHGARQARVEIEIDVLGKKFFFHRIAYTFASQKLDGIIFGIADSCASLAEEEEETKKKQYNRSRASFRLGRLI